MAILRIYKLVNSVDDFIYISSTYTLLNERLDRHIYLANSGVQNKLYTHMRLIGIDKFIIQLLEKVEIKTKEEYVQEEIDRLDSNYLLNARDAVLKKK